MLEDQSLFSPLKPDLFTLPFIVNAVIPGYLWTPPLQNKKIKTIVLLAVCLSHTLRLRLALVDFPHVYAEIHPHSSKRPMRVNHGFAVIRLAAHHLSGSRTSLVVSRCLLRSHWRFRIFHCPGVLWSCIFFKDLTMPPKCSVAAKAPSCEPKRRKMMMSEAEWTYIY